MSRRLLFDSLAYLVYAAPRALRVELHLEVSVEVQDRDSFVFLADQELLFVDEEVCLVHERAEQVLAEPGRVVEQQLDLLHGEVVELELVLDRLHGVLLVYDEVPPAAVWDAEQEEVPGVDHVFEVAGPLALDVPVFLLVLERREHSAGTEVVRLGEPGLRAL